MAEPSKQSPKTQVIRGKSLIFQRRIETGPLTGCPLMIVNRRESPLFWIFQDMAMLVLTRKIATYREWGVRAASGGIAAATAYWQSQSPRWAPFLDLCDATGVSPCIYWERGLISFEWYGPRTTGLFSGDTVPPSGELLEAFDAFVDGLETAEKSMD